MMKIDGKALDQYTKAELYVIYRMRFPVAGVAELDEIKAAIERHELFEKALKWGN